MVKEVAVKLSSSVHEMTREVEDEGVSDTVSPICKEYQKMPSVSDWQNQLKSTASLTRGHDSDR